MHSKDWKLRGGIAILAPKLSHKAQILAPKLSKRSIWPLNFWFPTQSLPCSFIARHVDSWRRKMTLLPFPNSFTSRQQLKKHRLQEYQKWFWKIAKAPNEQLFNYYKNKLAAKTPRGWLDLEKTDPVLWSRAWFKLGSNCESVDKNRSESFNSCIIESKFKPIITMLEDIRIQVTRRI